MNKQKAMKKLEELKAIHAEQAEEMNKLKAIIEAPDTSELVFKPERGEKYEYVGEDGEIHIDKWDNYLVDLKRLKVGNVFRVGESKNSAKYCLMNSEYDYWLPCSGQPKPKVSPKGLEVYYEAHWHESCAKMSESFMYRWKRSEQ